MDYAICYVSTASETLSKTEILSMLRAIKINNNANDIEGILINSGSNFFQLIEGEKSKVRNLYSKIQQDPRHHHIIKILDQPIDNSIFSNHKNEFCTISDILPRKHYLKRFISYSKQKHFKCYESISYVCLLYTSDAADE